MSRGLGDVYKRQAYRQGWISEERMREIAKPMLKNQYGQYLIKVIEEVRRTDSPNLDF